MKLSALFVSFSCFFLTVCIPSVSQIRMDAPTPDVRGWTDPALSFNKLLVGEGTYQLIGNYKVRGSSYLFGQKHMGDFFSPAENAYNIYLSYNTYNQEVEFYSTSNPSIPLVKEPGKLDSFILHSDLKVGITDPMKFIYGSLLGTKDKSYYQEIYAGKRFSIYKKYKSELGYDAGNYAQSELRQFDIEYGYYYTDTENKGLKKIKPNAPGVISEFKSIKDLSAIVNEESFTVNPEDAFRKAFNYLNN